VKVRPDYGDYDGITEVKLKVYLRGGWGVPKMIMRGSQDQEISSSK
jgi:hypothetical protein